MLFGISVWLTATPSDPAHMYNLGINAPVTTRHPGVPKNPEGNVVDGLSAVDPGDTFRFAYV